MPEDCDTINADDPECLIAVTVDGRPIYVDVGRRGPPTEVRISAAPKKEINPI